MSPPPPRGVADSEVTFTRQMTQFDANLLGNVHGGVIMREIDHAAGIAAARHAGRVCVTAAIDELTFLEPVHVGDLLVVQARVNDAWRTSLEVGVRVLAEPWHGRGERRHTSSAYVVLRALDDAGGPSEVPALLAASAEDRRRQAQARIRRDLRRERRERVGGYPPEAGTEG